jgi:hypothetical protein
LHCTSIPGSFIRLVGLHIHPGAFIWLDALRLYLGSVTRLVVLHLRPGYFIR